MRNSNFSRSKLARFCHFIRFNCLPAQLKERERERAARRERVRQKCISVCSFCACADDWLINTAAWEKHTHSLRSAAHISERREKQYTRHVLDLRFIPGASAAALWSMSQSKKGCTRCLRARALSLFYNNPKLLHECNNNESAHALVVSVIIKRCNKEKKCTRAAVCSG